MTAKTPSVEPVVVGWKGARQMTSLGATTIQKLVAEGDFPKPFKLTQRRVGWTKASIESWIQSREREGA